MTTFANTESGIESGAIGALAVTPSDGTDLARRIRGVTINGGGVISYIAWDGATNTTGVLPQGSYPMFARRILSTGTTATGITGWV